MAVDELARRVQEFGPHPFLVTTSAERRAHVVSVTVEFVGVRFALAAGKTSRANIAATETVTLLWPETGGAYALIVDGAAELDGASEMVTVTPTRAVLHRVANASADLPSCVRIEPS